MKYWTLFLWAFFLQAQSREEVTRQVHACLAAADPVTVLSLVQVESNFQTLAPSVNYPEAFAKEMGYRSGLINFQRQPRTQAEALDWIRWFEASHWTLSVGLLQVNVVEAAKLNISSDRLLEPCLNLQVGWRIFTKHYRRAAKQYGPGQTALQATISAYNTGTFKSGFSNGYVSRVLRAAQQSNEQKTAHPRRSEPSATP